jgi:hypothetical protein
MTIFIVPLDLERMTLDTQIFVLTGEGRFARDASIGVITHDVWVII